MVAQAQFSVTELRVHPGQSATLTLTLYNLSQSPETFSLIPSGLFAGWVHLDPPTMTLQPNASAAATVTVRPPSMSSTQAGPQPLTVRVVPQNNPDELFVTETAVVIEEFHDRRIHVLQPVRRGRRRAHFEFLVENHGNAHANCRLQLIDLSRRLEGRFEPPAVGVEPGSNTLVQLKTKAAKRQWRRGSRTLPFTIEATEAGSPTVETQATMVQTAILPEALGRKLGAVVAFAGAATAAWLFLLKPAAEDAAKDAVGATASQSVDPVAVDPVSTVIPTVSVVAQPSSDSLPTPATGAPAAVDGEHFTKRFAITPGPGNTASDVFAVPAGQRLEITDIVLQNPNFDAGSATLKRNADVLLPWLLDNSTGNEGLAFVNGLIFNAGDNVVFELSCSAVGDPEAGTCTTALLISGVLTPQG